LSKQPPVPSYIVRGFTLDPLQSSLASPSTKLLGPLSRTVASHGLTWPEIQRHNGAIHFLKPLWRKLWWVTTDKGSSRELVAEIHRRIAKLQRRQRLPPYRLTVLEVSGGLHAHIVFVGNQELAHSLKRSSFAAVIHVDKVDDPARLSRHYLAKERTPQAGYRRQLGARRKGSHKLAGGGDRVRLSRELERDAILASYVTPWQRTNARLGASRKPYPCRCVLRRKSLSATGQLLLLPELGKPANRLRHFRGGYVPTPIQREIEFQRQRRELSQQQLAGMVGLSQGHFANAMRGHDPISGFAVNRLRDVLLNRLK
jgi:hypothetical protein